MGRITTKQRNVLIGFFASVAMLAVSATASYISIKDLLIGFQWVEHTNTVNMKLNRLLTTLVDAETAMRGHLLTRDEEFLQPYKNAPATIRSLMDEVGQLTSDNGLQRTNIALLQKEVNIEMALLSRFIDHSRNKVTVPRDSLALGKLHMDNIREHIRQMISIEERLKEKRDLNMSKFKAFTVLSVAVVSFLSVAITLFFYFRIGKLAQAEK